jgi:hypothetical protein
MVAAMAALGAASPAWALGFGEPRSQVVLGQPLNLAIPVLLGEGESLGSECAAADVTPGDTRLQAAQVRTRVTQGRDASEAIIRVTTTVPIEEPVVMVAVSAGCPARITRSLTLLADPPLVAPVVATAPAPAPTTSTPAPARETAMPVSGATTPSAGEPPRRATRPAPPQRAARAATRVAPAAAAAAAASVPLQRRPATAGTLAPARSERVARPRLELDSARISTPEQAAAVEAQASAVRAAALLAEAAASAAQQRMQDMEAELARVRADAKAQTEALLQLRQQIAQDQAQRERQNLLAPFLMATAGVLALVAGWLGWRLYQQQSQPRREVWWDRAPASQLSSVAPGEDSQLGGAPPPRMARPDSVAGGLGAPLAAKQFAPDTFISPPTMPAPVTITIPPLKAVDDDESTRAMSVDEQIDLEQQADFFIALGHDEAAIDLLMAHLRSTGGGTPLPFLKLLEIHRRRADREAYERTRVRFNQRFNSIAPDWNADPKSGRSLEDYPLTIGRLQRAWPTPLDGMAELEALLFRRGTGAELFDLPAYQEVLFLYQMARDLHNAEQPADAVDTSVDVLLPIDAAGPPVPEGTIVLRPEFNHGEPLSLDLDLSTEPAPPAPEPPASAATDPAEPTIDLDAGEPSKPGGDEDVWGVTGNKRRDI